MEVEEYGSKVLTVSFKQLQKHFRMNILILDEYQPTSKIKELTIRLFFCLLLRGNILKVIFCFLLLKNW